MGGGSRVDDVLATVPPCPQVQVMTFLVGYGGDNANLESVACQNRGQVPVHS